MGYKIETDSDFYSSIKGDLQMLLMRRVEIFRRYKPASQIISTKWMTLKIR